MNQSPRKTDKYHHLIHNTRCTNCNDKYSFELLYLTPATYLNHEKKHSLF